MGPLRTLRRFVCLAEAARKEVSKESFAEHTCDEVGRKVQLLGAAG